MPDFVIVRLSGAAVDTMCSTNQDFDKYVVTEKGKKVLYVQLKKALYGYIKSALLWYETLKEKLTDMGFKLNRYDPCVANRTINGDQGTICRYVDDLKVSHRDPKVVEDIINQLEGKFGNMKVNRGSDDTFVGMNIKLKDDATIAINMDDYITECFPVFGEPVDGRANTPAKENLFDEGTDPEDKVLLSEDKSNRFRHIVAKLLFVAKGARIDIDLGISFLCTRVSSPTNGDWTKLKRLLVYLNNTLGMTRVIGARRLEVLQSWVDASFATRRDMESFPGGAMSLGRCVLHHRSEDKYSELDQGRNSRS